VAAKLRVATRAASGRCPCAATNRPTAQAETKQTTSAYENSFCQFQRIESIVLDLASGRTNAVARTIFDSYAKRLTSNAFGP
jgi:hypothetical protein